MRHGDSAARRSTVFIVDNDATMRASLVFLLDSAGLNAVAFDTAEAFLASCTADQPGCLVLDVRLPGMSGIALQERLEQLDIELPVIIITGFADVDTAVRALKGGAVEFFEKPFSDELLLNGVRQAMAVDAQRRAVRAERDRLIALLARLTTRERAVFDQVVQGKANKVVAFEFGISEKTVEAHRARVMHKLGASSLAELVRMDLAATELERFRSIPLPRMLETAFSAGARYQAHA